MHGHVPYATQMKRLLPSLRIIWAGIALTSVALCVVSRVVPFDAPSPSPNPVLGPVFLAVGLGVAVFGVVFPRTVVTGRGPSARRPASFMSAAIVGIALTESIALFGLVLKVMHVPGPFDLPLFAIAWILFALRFPTATRPLGPLGPPVDLTEPEPEASRPL